MIHELQNHAKHRHTHQTFILPDRSTAFDNLGCKSLRSRRFCCSCDTRPASLCFLLIKKMFWRISELRFCSHPLVQSLLPYLSHVKHLPSLTKPLLLLVYSTVSSLLSERTVKEERQWRELVNPDSAFLPSSLLFSLEHRQECHRYFLTPAGLIEDNLFLHTHHHKQVPFHSTYCTV